MDNTPIFNHLADNSRYVMSIIFATVLSPFKLHVQALKHETDVSIVHLVEACKHLAHVYPLGSIVRKLNGSKCTLREEALLNVPRTARQRDKTGIGQALSLIENNYDEVRELRRGTIEKQRKENGIKKVYRMRVQ